MTDLTDLVERVDLAATEPYLRARGWELVSQGALGNRWRLRQDHHTRNVALPLPLLDDLDRQRMLISVLQTLADTEGRHAALIVQDMREASSDLVEFRIIAEPLTAGECLCALRQNSPAVPTEPCRLRHGRRSPDARTTRKARSQPLSAGSSTARRSQAQTAVASSCASDSLPLRSRRRRRSRAWARRRRSSDE